MPELPEVETIRRDLAGVVLNKKITDLQIIKPRVLKNHSKQFKKNLIGNQITAVSRRGKMLILKLKNPPKFLLIHLKMTGQLIYESKQKLFGGGHSQSGFDLKQKLPSKHTRVIFCFQSGAKMFFNDIRLFGWLRVVDEAEKNQIIKTSFGLEPFSAGFTLKNFKNIFKTKKTRVKNILLNQKLIAGIGNIYVDEICWLAKIKPTRRANQLTNSEIKRLFRAVRPVLKKAIEHRGTTFRDYRDAGGRMGGFSKHLNIYGHEGENCRRNDQGIIKKTKIAGRGTRWCPVCQK